MFRLLRRMPFFRVLALGQTVLLARRHFRRLGREDRHRLSQLVRKGRGLSPAERHELRSILGKLEPKEFAFVTADRFSPVPLRRWMR